MWGLLNGVISGIETLWETITNIPQLIFNKFATFFENIITAVVEIPVKIKDNLIDLFNSIIETIFELPSLILNGLKELLIPDAEDIEKSFHDFVTMLKMKFNFNTDFFEWVFAEEQPVQDVSGEYYLHGVGTFNFKYLDASYLVQGVTYFRPFIRGFLVLLMVLYNIKQFIGFFGYDAGVIAGRQDSIAEHKESQRK